MPDTPASTAPAHSQAPAVDPSTLLAATGRLWLWSPEEWGFVCPSLPGWTLNDSESERWQLRLWGQNRSTWISGDVPAQVARLLPLPSLLLWTWPPYQPPRPPRDTVLCKLRRADRRRLYVDRLFCRAVGIPHDLADRLNGRTQ